MDSRSQFLNIGAATSTIRTINLGILQGSVLGPILYSIYTNELPELVKNENCGEICHQIMTFLGKIV